MRGHHALTAERTHGQPKNAGWNRSCTDVLGGSGTAGRSGAGGASAPPRGGEWRRIRGSCGAIRATGTNVVSRCVPSVTHWRPSPCHLIAVRPQCLACARATTDLHDVAQLPDTPHFLRTLVNAPEVVGTAQTRVGFRVRLDRARVATGPCTGAWSLCGLDQLATRRMRAGSRSRSWSASQTTESVLAFGGSCKRREAAEMAEREGMNGGEIRSDEQSSRPSPLPAGAGQGRGAFVGASLPPIQHYVPTRHWLACCGARTAHRGRQSGQEISPRLLAWGFPPERVTGIDAALSKLPRCSDTFRRLIPEQ